MDDLRQRLEQQNTARGREWGHLVTERLDAALTEAGASVLDVGCASGVYVDRLQQTGRTCVGADLLMYRKWQEPGYRFVLSDARFLPFASESFDTIISFETLEHVPGPEAALREYHRVCRKNIIISVPNCDIPPEFARANMTFFHYTDRTHVNFYTLDTLRQMVEANGFRVVRAAPILPVTPALPLIASLGVPLRYAGRLARWIRKISPKQYGMSLLVVADKV
jgi:2-polyprenyl-3-methyl-5-hydroxy-6-metoxy-1,4-benzoquinol methylase